MSSLKNRRKIARLKKNSQKTYNMRWVSEQLGQIIAELSEYAYIEPEVEKAIQALDIAKQCIREYSDRMLSTPYRSRYDGFSESGGFDNASSLFQQQVDKQREYDLESELIEEEKRSEAELRRRLSKLAEKRPRDENGQFI